MDKDAQPLFLFRAEDVVWHRLLNDLFISPPRKSTPFFFLTYLSLISGCQPEIAAVSKELQINYSSNEAGVRLTAILNVLGHIQSHVKDFFL